MYGLPEDETDVPKHVGVVKDYAFVCVCSVWIDLHFYMIYIHTELRSESRRRRYQPTWENNIKMDNK